MDNKPHSREKKVEAGFSEVRKGEKVGTSPVGTGGRESTNSQGHSGERNGDRSAGGAIKTGIIVLLLSRIFGSLSPKGKRIVIVVVAFLLILTMMRSCMPTDLSGLMDDPGSGSSVQQGTIAPDPQVTQPSQPSQPSQPAQPSQPSQPSQPTLDPGLSSGGSGNGSATTTPVTPGVAREKFYNPKANDTVTIMVYMCGTDLESKYSMGTSDLLEMSNATIADNVNIIVETGGCSKWQNNVISSSTNQIIKVASGGRVTKLEDNLGNLSMVNPLTLTSFIQYCARNYEAERYILIMWDHGGGSITGYGYDEKHSSDGSMDLAEFNSALKAAGIKFDWIGFDACLMGTLETAMVCDDYADYLIASEESEPGTGWYYTNWVTALSRNTSVATTDLAKTLIDDFYSSSIRSSSSAQVTLSIMDLAEIQGSVPPYLSAFSQSTNQMVQTNDYRTVSNARANARQFAASQRLNQIDLIDFADRIGTQDALNLAKVLRNCVKYNKTNISRANGVSIYFPYENTRSMNSALNTYNQIGFDTNYSSCIRNFASLVASGNISAGSSYSSGFGTTGGYSLSDLLGGGSDPLGSLLGGYTNSSGSYSSGYSVDTDLLFQMLSGFSGRSLPGDYSWIDEETVRNNAQYVIDNRLDPSRIAPTFNNAGKRVVSLTDEEWDLIQNVELNVYVDDGSGYIDLGRDNVFEIDGNDLLLDYDHTWLTVNRHVVAYYMESDVEEEDGSWTTTGYIPAILSSKDETGQAFEQYVKLEVVFDKENPDGVITGARPIYKTETETVSKGNIELKENDVLQFLCDYYSYEGNYDSSYKLGSPLTVPASGLTLTNRKIDYDCNVTYRLTDIYDNHYWTPAFVDAP